MRIAHHEAHSCAHHNNPGAADAVSATAGTCHQLHQPGMHSRCRPSRPLVMALQRSHADARTCCWCSLCWRSNSTKHSTSPLPAAAAGRSEPSLSLAFEYAEHDMYEIIWHHRDRLAGAAAAPHQPNQQITLLAQQ